MNILDRTSAKKQYIPIKHNSQWAKSPKNRSVGVYFWQCGTGFWVPN